ncbi:MAG: hypothetical protein U0174_03235 [Polyangiaceae bacterium]
MSRIAALLPLTLGALLGSCMDPVHSDAVDALGGETRGVRAGPEHRPGQPCLVCHGGDGPGSPEWSAAGTAYTTRGGADPLSGATVVLTDAKGVEQRLKTNRAGNFYIEARRWQPTYPLRARIESGSEKVEMQSLINGPSSCATCHHGAGSANSVPPIYLRMP